MRKAGALLLAWGLHVLAKARLLRCRRWTPLNLTGIPALRAAPQASLQELLEVEDQAELLEIELLAVLALLTAELRAVLALSMAEEQAALQELGPVERQLGEKPADQGLGCWALGFEQAALELLAAELRAALQELGPDWELPDWKQEPLKLRAMPLIRPASRK